MILRQPTTTVGFERRFKRAFSLMDEEALLRLMLQRISAHLCR